MRLLGVAELPARMSLKVNYADLETMYLERRVEYTNASHQTKLEEDALCKLGTEDVHRTCATVFTSKHFDDKMPLAAGARFEGRCELRTLTFQIPRLAVQYQGGKLKEWVMDSEPNPPDPKFHSKEYLISHAYESNQIIVYFQFINLKQVKFYALMIHVRIAYEKLEPSAT